MLGLNCSVGKITGDRPIFKLNVHGVRQVDSAVLYTHSYSNNNNLELILERDKPTHLNLH